METEDTLKVAVFCDYDGTITVEDTIDLMLDTYGQPGWLAISKRLDAEGATNVERMTAEFEGFRATRDEVKALVRERIHIDETFKDFADYVRGRGWKFAVLSQGVRESIETVFAKYGVTGIEWHANALVPLNGASTLSFPERGTIEDGCTHCCGVCKSGHIRMARREGFTTVYVGDGMTDRCAAATADVVFAKSHLVEIMTAKGLPFHAFGSFAEIRDNLASLFPAGA